MQAQHDDTRTDVARSHNVDGYVMIPHMSRPCSLHLDPKGLRVSMYCVTCYACDTRLVKYDCSKLVGREEGRGHQVQRSRALELVDGTAKSSGCRALIRSTFSLRRLPAHHD